MRPCSRLLFNRSRPCARQNRNWWCKRSRGAQPTMQSLNKGRQMICPYFLLISAQTIRVRIFNMKTRKLGRNIIILFILLSLGLGGYALYDRGRPAPIPRKQKLYDGVIYRRVIRLWPRPLIAHVLTINTKTNGIDFLITPPDSKSET